MKLIRLILLIIFSIALGASSGLYTYYQIKGFDQAYDTTNLTTELDRAVSTLANCTYIKRVYPRISRNIVPYFKSNIIALRATELAGDDMKRIIAQADPENHQIFLTSLFFALNAEQQEQVLAHEMLHLLGMPNHKAPLNRAKDAIYITTQKCYAELKHDTNNQFDLFDDDGLFTQQ